MIALQHMSSLQIIEAITMHLLLLLLHLVVSVTSLSTNYSKYHYWGAYLKDGQSIFIFPEGTRNKSGENNLLPFKDGAFRLAIDLQVPILPQVYINTDYIMPYKPLLMRPARIDVYYLDPISTEGLTMQDLQNLKEQVRSVISEEYNKRIKNN